VREGTVADHHSDDRVEGRHRQANVESVTEPVLFEAGVVGCPLMITRQRRYDWQLQQLPFGPTAAGSGQALREGEAIQIGPTRIFGNEAKKRFFGLPRPARQSREVVPGRRRPPSGGQGSMPPTMRRAAESRNRNRSL